MINCYEHHQIGGFLLFLMFGIFTLLSMCVCSWKIPNELTGFYHLNASRTTRWLLVFQAPVVEVVVGMLHVKLSWNQDGWNLNNLMFDGKG